MRTFDCADYAVEFTTEAGRVFTVSWDTPGDHTGVWLREVPARGSAYVADADVAVWDVSRVGRWDSFIGAEVTDVILRYRRWVDDGYECSRITVAFGDRSVELLLADSDADHLLVPSGNNIAVVFPPEPLPQWAFDQLEVHRAGQFPTWRHQERPPVRPTGLTAAAGRERP